MVVAKRTWHVLASLRRFARRVPSGGRAPSWMRCERICQRRRQTMKGFPEIQTAPRMERTSRVHIPVLRVGPEPNPPGFTTTLRNNLCTSRSVHSQCSEGCASGRHAARPGQVSPELQLTIGSCPGQRQHRHCADVHSFHGVQLRSASRMPSTIPMATGKAWVRGTTGSYLK